MNLPNKLTITRIALSILIIFLLLFPFYEVGIEFPNFIIKGLKIDSKMIICGIIFIIASITDYLDGYIARKYNLITNTGKILDAIADKLLINSVLIIFAYLGYINAIIPVILVTRDTVVNAIKLEASSKGRAVAAIKSGKIKTASLMIGTALMFFYNMPFELINIRIDLFFLYFATLMSIISMVEYFNINKKIIFSRNEELL